MLFSFNWSSCDQCHARPYWNPRQTVKPIKHSDILSIRDFFFALIFLKKNLHETLFILVPEFFHDPLNFYLKLNGALVRNVHI